MRVLAFSPYHGGSHRQFLEDWIQRSEHSFELLSLPPRHFKWRIRQASVGLAEKAARLVEEGAVFDLLWTTSIVDAAELRGLLAPALRTLPLVVYFHENQLTYPSRKKDVREQHFSLINWVSALAADAVWFNSEFNQSSFLEGLSTLLRKMPDEAPLTSLDKIARNSSVVPLGLDAGRPLPRQPGPLHIAWVGRWEHDKRPDLFFSALKVLKSDGVDFRLSCLGQSFRTWPPEFDEVRVSLSEEIEHMGFVEDRQSYRALLGKCDVVVSTADHEFFGLALLEAVGTGAVPALPHHLVYPEIYPTACLYDKKPGALVQRLKELAQRKERDGTLSALYEELSLRKVVAPFDWSVRAPALDQALAELVSNAKI